MESILMCLLLVMCLHPNGSNALDPSQVLHRPQIKENINLLVSKNNVLDSLDSIPCMF